MPVSVNELLRYFPDSRVEHKRNGVEVIVRHCPLHSMGLGKEHAELQWKLYINPSMGVAKCFVCHGPRQGIDLGKIVRRRLASVEDPNHMPPVHRAAVTGLPNVYCFPDLPDDHEGVRYLRERGVTPETAHACAVYWKPEGPACWLRDGEQKLARLKGLIIPVRVDVRLMGWQFGPIPRVDFLPKYINAPHSNMGGAFFNWDTVARRQRSIAIFEGLFDVLKLPDQSIGLFGNSITDDKARLLRSGGFREIVLCLDPDQSAAHANTMLKRMVGVAPIVRMHKLEGNRDPGDHSTEELKDVLGI